MKGLWKRWMEIKALIERINELARIKKTCGLTDDETAEQASLRCEYLGYIRAQVKSQLDCVEIVDKKELH